jgi:transcriptional regulator with XRE-family HTH domain
MEQRSKPDDSSAFSASLGAVLKRIRKDRKESQIDIAVAIGRQRTYVSELESGKHNATLDTLRLICGIYDVKLSDVIIETENNLK